MSAIVKLAKVATKFSNRNPAAVYTLARNHWNKDYKPGPYPRTQEERNKAAERYGLHPKEYEPYPEDEGLGDYPKLPDKGIESRDPYYPWDFPEHKRNFNEPLHNYIESIGEDRFNLGQRYLIHPHEQTLTFLAVMAGFFALYFLCEQYKFIHPHMPKQYPEEGKVHYTFEKLD
ncbi:NADH dehydrogenase [ubiquinone] 1 beta subcomplex subunit 8, mitochondrial-like [Ctenocephalides felis]|uniref:NADH dehydrogenase [ubiquinone] 1 beta subcomplex subunit 8, mitochondrial-like n=1 Tax=Ctenocephalides felis TaxID=7515 RepID=UPI000E6E3D96|nr:NADH dehydrogenase [ubiquinone] 1 beta subcomplex subunit 8, mitochondrial-like [Ctenocephalides felis]XP_026481214.1 NADH dehydrogenase [ubiquinone] 1 beta subcomplex subunit 8, mitochondrial-like [Ctenocephalides felis]